MSTETIPTARTLVDLLRQRAERHPDKVAFIFSPDGDEEESRLTYRELDTKARAIASVLQEQGAAGERVLVLCRHGLDTVAGFFGCFYAGAVAVPADEQATSKRLAAIVPDARASFVLATAQGQAKLRATVDGLVDGPPLRWCVIDELGGDAENWVMPDVDANTTAMVQYTSGSTGLPKGIVVSHGNVLHNLKIVADAWNPEPGSSAVFDNPVTAVCWLPQHHDIGLIAGVFATIYIDGTTVLMSPGAVAIRPMRWLEAVSRYRALISISPTYTYDWCVKRSTAEQRAALDLSNWSVAAIGGEQVRANTLRNFADAFAPAGFRPEAFCTVYGQAEATMGVSGMSDSPVPVVRYVDRAALGEDRVVDIAAEDPAAAPVVGCGPPQGGQRVVIADPETRQTCGEDAVGEIWVAGPSVTQGYWHKPKQTEQTFAAFLADTGEGPFLRTGDLGFLSSGELFVTGRCKDLMVIDSYSYYPNDIETTVQACHPALLTGRGAAFSVKPKRTAPEQLVVVQEVHRRELGDMELTDLISAIRAAITEHHDIEAHDVLLVKPMRIPTTSSFKIQRGQCRERFLTSDLEALAEWHAPPPPVDYAGNAKKLVGVLRLAGLVGRGLAQHNRESRQT